MIVYTVTGKVGQAGYLDIANSGDITGKNIYVNMTNRCPCSCVFCLRQTKKMMEVSVVNELVFCGYGEPLERLHDVCKVIDLLHGKYPKLKVRLNTNGLANLIHGRDVTPELEGRFDTVSISMNAPDAEEFLELTRSRFGIQSFDALKEFAALAKEHVPNVVMTVVEKVMPEEKIERCRKICEELGVTLRVRPFEE